MFIAVMPDHTRKHTFPSACGNLSPAEWLALDGVIFELHSCADIAELERFVLNTLPEKLGAAFASWNEHGADLRLERVANSDSHDALIAPLVPALNRSLPTHPLFPDYFDFSTGKVIYSDSVDRTRAAVSEEEYRNTDFFLNVAEGLGIEDQLVMHVYVMDGQGILLTFHGLREFTPEQHLKAAVMRGHIIARLHTLYEETARQEKSRHRIAAELGSVLSEREKDIVEHVCEGETNAAIAASLELSPRTVDKHLSNILRKLELANRYQLISKYAHWIRDGE